MNFTVHTCSGGMIYKSHFMKIGTGVQVICLSKLNGCNVGIIER
jgi:hypothetical protein